MGASQYYSPRVPYPSGSGNTISPRQNPHASANRNANKNSRQLPRILTNQPAGANNQSNVAQNMQGYMSKAFGNMSSQNGGFLNQQYSSPPPNGETNHSHGH